MTLPLPAFREQFAAPGWEVVDFISDLHLSEDTPRGFDAWSRWMRDTTADAVFILGDLFDAWVGDDARHSGFEARCAQTLSAAAARRYVGVMVGNRDFLMGPEFLSACGAEQLEDPTVLVIEGERFLLSHGDELCVGDTEYQQFRRMVRSEKWRHDFLALPLPERRLRAQQMRRQSTLHNKNRPAGQWFDVDHATALQWMRSANTPRLIHGHTHRPETEQLAPGFVRHVLSDWELDHAPLARGEVLRWQHGGLTRVPINP